MKRILIFAAMLAVLASSCSSRQDVKVLFVGGSPDFYVLSGTSADPETIAESTRERTADFAAFLRERFTEVTVIDGSEYTPGMSDDYDVTIFDGTPRELRPQIMERDASGRVTRYERAAYLPDDFDRATICIAEMSEHVGRSVGTKNDWFCLCLDNYALGWDAAHPIFNGPFRVKIESEMLPTPDSAKEYGPIYGYTLPEQTEMWKVHEPTWENGGRIGMVARPWGYGDSPETEIISGGKCSKSIDAVAIGRHGNFFHWGFSAKPSDMTEAGRAAFANAIVYMKAFNGCRIIARKLDEGIVTRDNAQANKFMASRACLEESYKSNLKFYYQTDSIIKAVRAKKAAGETLTPNEEMYLQFPTPQMPQKQEFGRYLQSRFRELYAEFGEDEAAYARYFEQNKPYFYSKPGRNSLMLDAEAKALGIANNDIRLLDKAVEMLAAGGDAAVTGRTLLDRYTLCRFETPEEWQAWLAANRERMFFTESGGWLWLVNTDNPAVPGNDYSVLTAPSEPERKPVKPAGETDRENPVALKATVENLPDGRKEVVVVMTVHEGFHTYAILAEGDPFIPTEVTVELPEGYRKVGSMQLPETSPSSSATTYYTGTGAFRQRIAGSGSGTVKCTVKYQVCDSNICMPPVTKEFDLPVK